MQTQTIQLKNIQAKYLQIKTEAEKLYKETCILNKPLHEAVDAGTISEDEWAEKVVDNEYVTGYNQKRTELINIENELITAARQVVQKLATPKQWETLKVVFDTQIVGVREKVINLALQVKED